MFSNKAESKKMGLVLVEDNPGVQNDITNSLLSRYLNQIEIYVLPDWPTAQARLKNLLDHSHLVLSDMNLRDYAEANPPNEPFLRTEFDGLRVFGFVKKHRPSVPVILYTAHDLAQNALDQLDDPNGPVWVVIKRGKEEIQSCADRLATVAQSILWDVSLASRESIVRRLELEGAAVLEEAIAEGLPSWKSVLAVLSAKSDSLMPGALELERLRGQLSQFLASRAFKFSLLARMFKPRDYRWQTGGESFGISGPVDRLDDRRAAWEQLLHPITLGFSADPDAWISAWNTSITDARREFDGCEHSFSKATAITLRNCLAAADRLKVIALDDPLRLPSESEAYASSHSTPIYLSLFRNWSSVLNRIFTGLQNHSITEHPYWAEWEQISKALNYICTSARKHGGDLKIRLLIISSEEDQPWQLRLVISDEGPGIREFSSAFVDPSVVQPNVRISNHKLQRAQILLWGYCNWSVVSKTGTETRARAHDVFSSVEQVKHNDGVFRKSIEILSASESGTVHILDFPCPLPTNGVVQNATMDLRFKG